MATKKQKAPVSKKMASKKPVPLAAPRKKKMVGMKKVAPGVYVPKTKASPAKDTKKEGTTKERDEEVVKGALDSKPGGRDHTLLHIALDYMKSLKAAGLAHDFNFTKQSKGLSAETVADIKAKAQRVESASASLNESERFMSQFLLTSGASIVVQCMSEIYKCKVLTGRRPSYIVFND